MCSNCFIEGNLTQFFKHFLWSGWALFVIRPSQWNRQRSLLTDHLLAAFKPSIPFKAPLRTRNICLPAVSQSGCNKLETSTSRIMALRHARVWFTSKKGNLTNHTCNVNNTKCTNEGVAGGCNYTSCLQWPRRDCFKKCYLDRGDRVEVKASWQKIIFLCSCIARNHKWAIH